MLNITQLSDIITREISDEENVSISRVSFWLRSQIGALNTLIATCYSIDELTLDYSPNLDEGSAAILKEMYFIYYYDKMFKQSIGSSGYTIVEAREGDSMVRRTARTEFGKLYLQAKKDHQTQLDKLTDLYKRNRAIMHGINIVEGCPLPSNC